jgi:hypothetical protein
MFSCKEFLSPGSAVIWKWVMKPQGERTNHPPPHIISAVETVLKLRKNEKHIGRYSIAEDFRPAYLYG